MPRLVSPTGITVNVSDEKATQLAAVGYRAADAAQKAPAKKAASRKSSDS